MRSITVITICLLARSVFAAECENGTRNACPVMNTKCFAADAGKSRASAEAGAKGYLECNSDCIWTMKTCPEGKYYTERLQDCVPPEDADVGAVLACEGRMNILDPLDGWFMTECVQEFCSNFGNFSADRRVETFVRGIRPIVRKSQTLFVERLPNSIYHRFVFETPENGEFHVLTESGTEVWSKLFKEDPSPDNMVWRVVPTRPSFRREQFQLVSPATGQAITRSVFSRNLEMLTLDKNNLRQMWIRISFSF